MEIITAKSAGFCFGVKRAVDMAIDTAAVNEDGIYTFGPLIHNESVITDLEKKHITAISSDIHNCPQSTDKTILIRAHGVAKKTEEELRNRFTNVVDATCPFVKKIHRIVEEHSKAGEQIVIFGNPDHPEVIGIEGYAAGESYVVSCEEEAKNLVLDPERKVCIVAQTTFHFNKFQYFLEIISKNVYDVYAVNTICSATEERQKEAAAIAERADAMLVIGGKDSSNTRKLFEICLAQCPNTQFLQTADDLDVAKLEGADCIGITAGASTPDHIIEEVQEKCQKRIVLPRCLRRT